MKVASRLECDMSARVFGDDVTTGNRSVSSHNIKTAGVTLRVTPRHTLRAYGNTEESWRPVWRQNGSSQQHVAAQEWARMLEVLGAHSWQRMGPKNVWVDQYQAPANSAGNARTVQQGSSSNGCGVAVTLR